jgi:hypothetical protein
MVVSIRRLNCFISRYATSVVLEVTYAEPGIKGNTATNAKNPQL